MREKWYSSVFRFDISFLSLARNAFHAFDFLNKGYVTAFDLKAALLYVVEKASEKDKDDFIKFFK